MPHSPGVSALLKASTSCASWIQRLAQIAVSGLRDCRGLYGGGYLGGRDPLLSYSVGAAVRTMWYLPSAIFANHAARIRDALAAVGVAWDATDVERCQPLLRQAIRRTHPDKAAGAEDLYARAT